MLNFPLYKMNIATKQVDYNTKWVISVAEMDVIDPIPSDPLMYNWTTNQEIRTSQGGHWYASPAYIKRAFPEVGTMFLPKVNNYSSTIAVYYGAWAYKRTSSISYGPVDFKGSGKPVVYATYEDFVNRVKGTSATMTKAYNPYTLKSIFGTSRLVSEGYEGNYSNRLNGIPTKFLPAGYAWYNPSNGRYMTNTNTERKVYDYNGNLLESKDISLGAGYDATFMAVKKGTLVNGRITRDTYVQFPQFRVYEGVYYTDPKRETILPWDPSLMFVYNVRSEDYTGYFYKDVMVSYPKDWRKLSSYTSYKYFRLLEGSDPTPSIYWNGDRSENPIVNVNGTNYVHSDAYVWNGNYGSAVETIYGAYDYQNGSEILTKYPSWEAYYASEEYRRAEEYYEQNYQYCYSEDMYFVGYKGFVIETASGIPGYYDEYDPEQGWIYKPTHFRAARGSPVWEKWWKRCPCEPYPQL